MFPRRCCLMATLSCCFVYMRCCCWPKALTSRPPTCTTRGPLGCKPPTPTTNHSDRSRNWTPRRRPPTNRMPRRSGQLVAREHSGPRTEPSPAPRPRLGFRCGRSSIAADNVVRHRARFSYRVIPALASAGRTSAVFACGGERVPAERCTLRLTRGSRRRGH